VRFTVQHNNVYAREMRAVESWVVWRADCHIPAGTPLCWDYGMVVKGRTACLCGAPTCKGFFR
jgi:uncharacterized protein YbdZ (MbtH family)